MNRTGKAAVVLAALLALGAVAAVLWLRDTGESSAKRPAGGGDRNPPSGPAAHLSPEQVVVLQLQGLQDNGNDDDGIAVCFSFASPSNRREQPASSGFSHKNK